jgi:hypothetical protein
LPNLRRTVRERMYPQLGDDLIVRFAVWHRILRSTCSSGRAKRTRGGCRTIRHERKCSARVGPLHHWQRTPRGPSRGSAMCQVRTSEVAQSKRGRQLRRHLLL